ncbi:MAG: putative toxin-antitoxin system toxin component, PIN family [Silvibacterium sp.]|nr:putative toxin-antitoxin system toxin component, PIN family [Silvibacterium sp.]
MRFVLDTSVLVAAFRSNTGASSALIEAALLKTFTLIGTTNLFFEYEAVLTRPEHLAASGLSAEEVREILDALAAVVVEIHPSYLWRAQLGDSDDDMVLEAAINGRADAIVTFNVRDFGVIPARFGIRVLLPGEALKGLLQ